MLKIPIVAQVGMTWALAWSASVLKRAEGLIVVVDVVRLLSKRSSANFVVGFWLHWATFSLSYIITRTFTSITTPGGADKLFTEKEKDKSQYI